MRGEVAIWDVVLSKFLRTILLLVVVQTLPGQGHSLDVVPGGPEVSSQALDVVRSRGEAGLARLAPMFRPKRTGPIRIVVHRNEESLPSTLRHSLHPGTAGLALLGRDEIHLLLAEARRQPPDDLRTVVEHELVHVLLDRHAGRAGMFVSRWFHEGLAQALTSAIYLGASEEALVFRLRAGTLPTFRELHRAFPRDDRIALSIAYAQSFSFVNFLLRETELSVLLDAAARSTADGTYDEAFRAATGRALAEVEERWRQWLRTGSGAGLRVLLENCFGLALALALPLLVLAGIRVWNREHRRSLALGSREQEVTTVFGAPLPGEDEIVDAVFESDLQRDGSDRRRRRGR